MKRIISINAATQPEPFVWGDSIVPDCAFEHVLSSLLEEEFLTTIVVEEDYEPGDEIVVIQDYWIPELDDVEIDYLGNYMRGEEKMSNILRAKGWEQLRPWKTGDGDSWGPLTRYSDWITPDCETVRVMYG